jgi:hypothetical protein
MTGRPRHQSSHRQGVATLRAAWWSILVAIGMLATQVLTIGDLVLFTHTRCEHGALVHGARMAEGGVWRAFLALQSAPAAALREAGLYASPAPRSDADHDHCNASATPPAVISVEPPSVLPLLMPAPSAGSIGAREAERAVPALSLAPKTSPTTV